MCLWPTCFGVRSAQSGTMDKLPDNRLMRTGNQLADRGHLTGNYGQATHKSLRAPAIYFGTLWPCLANPCLARFWPGRRSGTGHGGDIELGTQANV